MDIAKSISEGLARKVIAAGVNGQGMGCIKDRSRRMLR
jgi:hypothetical protein